DAAAPPRRGDPQLRPDHAEAGAPAERLPQAWRTRTDRPPALPADRERGRRGAVLGGPGGPGRGRGRPVAARGDERRGTAGLPATRFRTPAAAAEPALRPGHPQAAPEHRD